ncbi:MAG TPA: hypothetical protein VIH71_15830 [Solirubrobacteraceae bacterium]
MKIETSSEESSDEAMQEAVRERNPNTDLERLVEALLDPVSRCARRLALEAHRE